MTQRHEQVSQVRELFMRTKEKGLAVPELTYFANKVGEGEQRQGFSPEMSRKAVAVGTHRLCPPEVTLARVQPFLSLMGITRVADVTWLDNLGLPVFQA